MNKLNNLMQLAVLLLLATTWLVWPPVQNSARWRQVVAIEPVRPRGEPSKAKPVELICAFGVIDHGQNRQLLQLLGEHDKNLARALVDFERKYRVLHNQLQQPDFVATRDNLKALSAYSQILTAQNQSQAAQLAGIDTLRAALQCAHHPADVLGSRAFDQAEALSTIELLLARTDWSEANLSELSRLLKAGELPPDLVVQNLQDQMRLIERGWAGDFPPRYCSIPFGQERHKRIFQNQSVEILGQLESGVRLPVPSPRREGTSDHSFWSNETDPCLKFAGSAQRRLAFTRLRQQLDLQWVEALGGGNPSAVGAPIEAWLRPELENTLSCCWILKGDRMQLAPWCIRFPGK